MRLIDADKLIKEIDEKATSLMECIHIIEQQESITNKEKMQSLKKEIEKVKQTPLFYMVSKDTIVEVILDIIDKYINEEMEE